MKTYETYKDSGIEWIGEIPEHWSSVSLKWISKIYSGGTPSKNKPEYWSDGTIPWLNSGTVNQGDITEPSEYITEEALANSSAKWIPEKAILIALAGQGKTKGMVAQTQFEATCNQSLGIIVPSYPELNRYLLFWLRKNYQNIRNLGGGDKRDGINLEMIGSIPTPLPTKKEQTAITNYLDKKTTEIDQLISEKEELVQLYQEEKTALINQAVTKGIKPDAKLKNSGIEWLGEIPEDWNSLRLKYLGNFINGYSFKSTDFKSSGVRVLKISNIQHMAIDWSDESFIDEEFYDTKSGFRVLQNDLVFALTRPIISTGIKVALMNFDEKILLNQRNSIFRPKTKMTKWIYFILLSSRFVQEFDKRIDKTGQQPNISSNDIGEISIPVPTKEEQTKIVEHIEKETAKIDTKIAKAEKYINLLTEYRTSLISEVVTGKIKVID
ncbi:type I restriction-modification system, S subunit [unidentified eubacterium SCB49]|nr:type I restriction-modification system, S subunit [unidentified eubacterium SCB49]